MYVLQIVKPHDNTFEETDLGHKMSIIDVVVEKKN